MPTDRNSVNVILRFLATLGIKEAQKVLKDRLFVNSTAQIAMLKELYADKF